MTKLLHIQGMRALAVMAVFVFHANSDWLPGGYLGVDAFFVISGFLMASILVNREPSNFKDVLFFYKRRLSRVAPAALLIAMLTIPVAGIVLLPFELRDYSASLVGVVTGTMNIMVANNIGYFSPLAEIQPLIHYWSLIVELHFYLLIPFVFLLVKSRKNQLLSLSLLFFVSLIYAHYLSQYEANDAYYLLPSRAWEFLAGSVAFLLNLKPQKTLSPLITYLSLAVISGYFILFTSEIVHPSLMTLPFVLATAVILGRLSTRPSEILASKVMVFLGDRSYSLYLWHFPILILVKQYFEIDAVLFVLAFVLTLILSIFSYRSIEQVFSQRGTYFVSKAKSKMLYGGACSFLMIVGLYGFQSKGFAETWKSYSSEPSSKAYDNYIRGKRHIDPPKVADACVYADAKEIFNQVTRLDLCKTKHGSGILVIGDSHTFGIFRALYHLNITNEANNPFLVAWAKGGCGVGSDRPDCFFSKLVEKPDFIAKYFKLVIYVQRGFSEKQYTKVDLFLDELSKRSRVIWLGPRQEPLVEVRGYVKDGCDVEVKVDEKHMQALSEINKDIELRSQVRKYEFINSDLYKMPFYANCSQMNWKDTDHWSQQGIELIAPTLNELLKSYLVKH